MKRHNGFTFIELLIVVATIAILAAIAVPNFLEAQIRSKLSRVSQDMDVIEAALHAYFADHNAYPPSTPEMMEAISKPWDYPRNLWSNPPNEFAEINAIAWSGYALRVLTTPVAYLSRDIGKDPFSDLKGAPLGFVNLIEAREKYSLNSKDDTRRYFLFTWSPWSSIPMNPLAEPVIAYDPTNGTTSGGVVARFGN